uniref:M-phase inducer phosphatase n=1 Tax=Leptobrachium leishanense TaxID=445787 RepID=A0A8C5MSH8_9ANUR
MSVFLNSYPQDPLTGLVCGISKAQHRLRSDLQGAEAMAESRSVPPDGATASGLAYRTNCRMILNVLQKDSSLGFSPEQPLTPISDLAVGFSNLSTFTGETPKRCLNLSNLSSDEVSLQALESPEKLTGKEDSPKSQCIRLLDNLFTPEPERKPRKCPRERLHPKLPRLLCSTPSFKKSSAGVRDDCNKENECESFKDTGNTDSLPLLRVEPGTPLSPTFGVKGDISSEDDGDLQVLGSPISNVPRGVDEVPDGKTQNLDGFSEFFCVDEDDMEVSMNRSRLYRSPSMPEKLDRPMLKRPVRPVDDETPVRVKRRRSTNGRLHEEDEENKPSRRRGPLLKKTLSLCDVDISKVLDEDCGNRQLIGDFSKVYALPTVTGRHQELRYITGETISALIHGEFNSLVERFIIIDCRYPYEYEGGHIRGALNLHRQEEVEDYFLKTPLVPSIVQKRIILIFHCEFSSERGPKMYRLLREADRARNEYPSLYYPELYLLKGGYKDFYPEYKELCEPQSYCPMHHQDHRDELLKFRTKSKSWAGERKRREQIARLMKL